ncbi:MAG TPA: hypothetical protein VLL08_17975 [Kineosporiaceae bacterium]|nr:hypothetical protein [Kineosporiaceae bacterium]
MTRRLGQAAYPLRVRLRCTAGGPLSDTVTVSTSRAANGRRVHVVHNWSWDEVGLTLPAALTLTDTATDQPIGTADVRLGAWDVRVLTEGLTPIACRRHPRGRL